MYKKLLNVKYRLMEDKRIEILTLLRAQERWDFKADERQQNDCSSGGIKFEGIRVPKLASSIRKTRRYQKGFRKRPVLENDKTCTKENISLYCVQDGQKDERKTSETFQETPIECSNGSEASEEEHLFVGPEESRNWLFIFSDEKTFTCDRVFNKENDRFVTFRIDS